MNLKRLINFCIISCFCFLLVAQNDAAWLKGGVNFANVSYNSSKEKIEYSNDDPTTFNNEEGTGLGEG